MIAEPNQETDPTIKGLEYLIGRCIEIMNSKHRETPQTPISKAADRLRRDLKF